MITMVPPGFIIFKDQYGALCVRWIRTNSPNPILVRLWGSLTMDLGCWTLCWKVYFTASPNLVFPASSLMLESGDHQTCSYQRKPVSGLWGSAS